MAAASTSHGKQVVLRAAWHCHRMSLLGAVPCTFSESQLLSPLLQSASTHRIASQMASHSNPFAILSDSSLYRQEQPELLAAAPRLRRAPPVLAPAVATEPSRPAVLPSPKLPEALPIHPSVLDHMPDSARDSRRPFHSPGMKPSSKTEVPHSRQGRRAYDRHSGMGLSPFMKKGGAGMANWGDSKHMAHILDDNEARLFPVPERAMAFPASDDDVDAAADADAADASAMKQPEEEAGAGLPEGGRKKRWDAYKRDIHLDLDAGSRIVPQRQANDSAVDDHKWHGMALRELVRQ